MKYVGRYTSGGGDHDPRQRTWVKYQCEECGKVHAFDKTVQIRTGTFLQDYFGRDLKCEECGSYGQSDEAREKQLKEELEELTQEMSVLEVKKQRVLNQLKNLGSDSAYEEKLQEERSKSLLWNA